MRVLVVEDEVRIASFLVKGLTARGYAVEAVGDGESALRRAEEFDLVVLDLGLPDVNGFEVLRRLRGSGSVVPVLILTSRGEIDDRVEGFRLGADDYLTKPFAFDELVARVEARGRPRSAASGHELVANGLVLDLRTRRATVDGRTVDLSAREFALLETFLEHPGQVLSREQLLSRVWGLGFDPGTNVVDVYVGYLRRKLGDRCIETVRGMGYRLLGLTG